jgi:hypothetical protein
MESGKDLRSKINRPMSQSISADTRPTPTAKTLTNTRRRASPTQTNEKLPNKAKI